MAGVKDLTKVTTIDRRSNYYLDEQLVDKRLEIDQLINHEKFLFGGNEYIRIEYNANNPPKIKQNTKFSFSDNLGKTKYVQETLDVTFVWGAGGVPSQSDATWYIACNDITNTNTIIDTAVYVISQNAISYNYEKKGFYNSDGKVLCSFNSTAGIVSQLTIFENNHIISEIDPFIIPPQKTFKWTNLLSNVIFYAEELTALSDWKTLSDINHEKFLFGGNEYIRIEYNANNPPKIKQNTKTGFVNNNNKVKYILESSDVTFVWGTGGVPLQSDGAWYIAANSLTNSEKLQDTGVYIISQNAISYNYEKKGFYNSDGKVLCSFNSNAGIVSQLTIFENNHIISELEPFIIPPQKTFQWINTTQKIVYYAENATSLIDWKMLKGNEHLNSLYIDGTPDLILDESVLFGKSFSQQNFGLFSGLINLHWYFIVIREDNHTISLVDAESLVIPGWTPSFSNNQLDMLSLYDQNYNYCRYQNTNYYRILYVFKTNSASTFFDDFTLRKILHYPNSFVTMSNPAQQLIFDSVERYNDFSQINIDVNSEMSGTTSSRRFTTKTTKKVSITFQTSARIRINTGVGGQAVYIQNAQINNNIIMQQQYEITGSSTIIQQETITVFSTTRAVISKNSYMDIKYEASGTNVDAVNSSFNYNSAKNGTFYQIEEM